MFFKHEKDHQIKSLTKELSMERLSAFADSFLRKQERRLLFEVMKNASDLRRLKKLTDGFATQNELLNQTELAMLNLLDDAKLLEGKLEMEKESVERKVVLRTQELEVERSRLFASINSLSFGFIIVDMNHRVLLENNAMMQLFGFSDKDEVTIENISNLLGEHFDVKMEAERCVKGKAVCEIKEIIFGTKFLRGIIAPVLSGTADEKVGYVFLLEDITEAKVMERSREEFFAVASHELRTPLTAIRGNADMILSMFADKIVDKDMKEMLEDIDTSSVRLISIVNDFLEVSRLEQGRVEIKKEDFDISLMVERVVRDLKTMVEQKGLSIVYTAPTSPMPMVRADKNKTEQILLNLVGNAVKFTKEGGITVTTTVADGFVTTQIIDTGTGISEHNQSLLFRKFQQAGEQMLARDVTQSTGLGLYISKLIITNMGGTIGLSKSEFGKGSTFFFTLPIVV